jgi:hypothetical protein
LQAAGIEFDSNQGTAWGLTDKKTFLNLDLLTSYSQFWIHDNTKSLLLQFSFNPYQVIELPQVLNTAQTLLCIKSTRTVSEIK